MIVKILKRERRKNLDVQKHAERMKNITWQKHKASGFRDDSLWESHEYWDDLLTFTIRKGAYLNEQLYQFKEWWN